MAAFETIGRAALRIRADDVAALFEAEPKRRFLVSNFSSEDVFARGFAHVGSRGLTGYWRDARTGGRNCCWRPARSRRRGLGACRNRCRFLTHNCFVTWPALKIPGRNPAERDEQDNDGSRNDPRRFLRGNGRAWRGR